MAEPRKLANSKWEMRVTGHCPKTGRRVTRRKQYSSRRKAKLAEADLRAEIAAGPTPERTTLGELVRLWLESKGKTWKPKTLAHNETTTRLHILPTFGTWWVDGIGRRDVLAWRDEQEKTVYRTPRHSKRKDVTVKWRTPGPHAINGRVRVLSAVLGWAAEREYIDANPCQYVKPLPETKTTKVIGPEALSRLLTVAEANWPEYCPMLVIDVHTGLRWGELSALQWRDVDEERGVLHVRRAISNGIPVDSTKDGRHRTLPLVPAMLDAIDRQRQLHDVMEAERRERCERQAREFVPSIWLFTGPRSGSFLRNGGRFSRVMKAAKAEAAIPEDVSWHWLRHSFNNLARQAASETVARSMTGHSTEQMTEHYSHVGDDEKMAAVLDISKRVGRK